MKKQQARLILYQLAMARKALQAIAEGTEMPQRIAIAYFFNSIYTSREDVDAFFDGEGKSIAQQFGV